MNASDQKALRDAIYYMNMSELKRCCQVLAIPESGKKAELIDNIISFIKTGKVVKRDTMPPESLAKNHPPQGLTKNGLMLYGSYKNDDKTRALFKSLVGPHFHFTAFGIDWLNEQWLKGMPPTYQQFSDYWTKEMERRKQKKAKPKQEWTYLNFLQYHSSGYTSKIDLLKAWKKVRAEKAVLAQKIIARIKIH